MSDGGLGIVDNSQSEQMESDLEKLRQEILALKTTLHTDLSGMEGSIDRVHAGTWYMTAKLQDLRNTLHDDVVELKTTLHTDLSGVEGSIDRVHASSCYMTTKLQDLRNTLHDDVVELKTTLHTDLSGVEGSIDRVHAGTWYMSTKLHDLKNTLHEDLSGLNTNTKSSADSLLLLKNGVIDLSGALYAGFGAVSGSLAAATSSITQTMIDLSGSTDVNINVHDLVSCADDSLSEQINSLTHTIRNLEIKMNDPTLINFERIRTQVTDPTSDITYDSITWEMNKDPTFNDISANNIKLTSDIHAGGDANIAGKVNISGGLEVDGKVDISGDVDVDGKIYSTSGVTSTNMSIR